MQWNYGTHYANTVREWESGVSLSGTDKCLCAVSTEIVKSNSKGYERVSVDDFVKTALKHVSL